MNNTALRWYGDYSDSRDSDHRLSMIVNHLEESALVPPTEASVLDLGAHEGFFSKNLADLGFRVSAVEPPSGKSILHPLVTEYRHWVQSADDLPEGPFDYSLVLSVLHHIPDWKSVLEGVIERTRHKVFIEVPHPKEHHSLWHGSLQQHEFLSHQWDKQAYVIGTARDASGRYQREMWVWDVHPNIESF